MDNVLLLLLLLYYYYFCVRQMCAMAKRLNFLNLPTPPDLFVLEFAVNDYQGQDHRVHIDHKTDVFFDGFVSIAACAETVVYRLLTDYPNAAVVFLEFQTAILNRKTAQLLHMGVAQHYQVPVLSYADVLWPDFYRLFDILKPNNYSVPATLEIDSVLPFPHGCAPCQADHISNQFRAFGCKSVCVFAKRSGYFAGEASICDTDGWHHRPCYVPFLAHDAVHPSVVGHQIARDLIVHFLAETAHRVCRGQTFAPHVLPTHSGWLVAGPQYPQKLRMRSDFVLVRDTMEIFAHQNPLLAHHHSAGFQLKDDALSRKGWISENPMGDETITFQFDLPREKCYAVFLTVLRSYETVGSFSVVVHDKFQNTSTPPRRIDCLWEPHISVPIDMQITPDHRAQCTGQCAVTVTTLPEIADGRQGNLIKIMSLSVRKCITKPL